MWSRALASGHSVELWPLSVGALAVAGSAVLRPSYSFEGVGALF